MNTHVSLHLSHTLKFWFSVKKNVSLFVLISFPLSNINTFIFPTISQKFHCFVLYVPAPSASYFSSSFLFTSTLWRFQLLDEIFSASSFYHSRSNLTCKLRCLYLNNLRSACQCLLLLLFFFNLFYPCFS